MKPTLRRNISLLVVYSFMAGARGGWKSGELGAFSDDSFHQVKLTKRLFRGGLELGVALRQNLNESSR